MESILKKEAFTKLLCSKERELAYTRHSIKQAKKRGIIEDHERTVLRFEKDIKNNEPHLVVEQDLEYEGERKFKLYYQAPEGGFITYIIVLNRQIRLISIYKTSKKLQRVAYDYEKTRMQNTKRKRI